MPACLLLCAALLATPNLVANPGFEQGAAGWSLPSNFSLDTTVAHGGVASLKVVNTDPKVYQLATTPLHVKSGHHYRFSAWIKTRGVQGEDSGATVCMEWSKGGQYLGGEYPTGFKGDHDWEQVSAEAAVPAEADSVSLTLYLRKGCTGTAWFDDAEVTEIIPPALAARLMATYRDRTYLYKGQQSVWLQTRIDPQAREAHVADGLTLRVYLRDGEPWRALAAEPDTKPQGWVQTLLRLGDLPPGRHALAVALTAGGLELGRVALEVEVPEAATPAVYVSNDAGHPLLMVDGKPFFPLGLYLSDFKPAELKTIADAGFNCVMPYNSYSGSLEEIRAKLDAAQAVGLKVIFSVKDFYDKTDWRPKSVLGETDVDKMTAKVVTAFRDHPALLAWYINDELPTTMHDVLVKRYQQVRALDPNHPCWAVLYQVGTMERYADTCDILGSDPYPIPDQPLSMPFDWTTKTRDAGAPGRALWMVPQIFDHACYEKDAAAKAKMRAPTLAEMRNMTYQCLIAGATGLIYYSWFDVQRDPKGFETRWADVKVLADEVRQLTPRLLAARFPFWQVQTAHGEGAVKAGASDSLILAANPSTKPGVVRVEAGGHQLHLLFGRPTAVTDKEIDLPPGEAAAVVMQQP